MDRGRFRDRFSHVGGPDYSTAQGGHSGAVSRGRACGLHRYRRKACGKAFSALTGATLSHAPPALDADSVKEALVEPVVAPDALLVSDADHCYAPAAAALVIPHKTVSSSAGEALHIQTVDSRHGQIRGLLRRFPVFATKDLDSQSRWFRLTELADRPPLRACLAAAMAKPCLRFAD